MSILIKNIKGLAGIHEQGVDRVAGQHMSSLVEIENAFLFLEKDSISAFGKMSECSVTASHTIDASGRYVLPGWCDSHTHLVFAAWRENEFTDRIKGLTYEQIAARGGGIYNSSTKVRNASEDELYASSFERLNEIMQMGTGAVEIKSGYGLTVEDELKMLRVIKKLRATHPLTIKSTLLIHAIPKEYSRKEYINIVINELIPEVGQQQLADFCDVFCERNYFTAEETFEILTAGKKHGIIGKVHAEQLSHSGGIEAGVNAGAISVDHLEYISDLDIELISRSQTIPTILPGAQLFLNLQKPPVRKMIEAGLPVAIASDYNPGSSPTGNMNLMIALSCILYNMMPEEAINAATLNSAHAMGLSDTHGSITVGKKANVIITKPIPSIGFIPYAFGSNLIDQVIINGKIS